MRHVIFLLDKERYALPLSAIREVVIPPETYTRVPRSPPLAKGVINLRGRVVLVIELERLMGLPGGGPHAKIVLLDRGRRDVGLLVTDVEGIESIERVGQPHGKIVPGLKGVARLRGQAVTVLEPNGLDEAISAAFTR